MTITTKCGAVSATYADNHAGDVEFDRLGLTVNVPFKLMEEVVANKLRYQMMRELEDLKPNEILGLAASKAKK